MALNKLKDFFKGASGDSILMTIVNLVTLCFSLIMTKILSVNLSLQQYGTYSQVMLLVSTIGSVTIIGMVDGLNFFFFQEKDENERNKYISTIFFLLYLIGAFSFIIVLSCSIPISIAFDNPDLKPLIFFAALLPILQNSTSLLQIMFLALGKAKTIAFRNFIISILKLFVVILICYKFNNIIILLIFLILSEIIQNIYFLIILRKNNCIINVFKYDKALIKKILFYCIPLGISTIMKTLNRDADKYIIALFTDTETLAIYTNVSKMLPFNIVMSSFATVLLPYIIKMVKNKMFKNTIRIYKSFLSISYTITTILAVGAICVAPELIKLLYGEKYLNSNFSIYVFVIYILVDIFNFLNIVTILNALGKSKEIMLITIGSFVLNIILNIVLFYALGKVGPAIATLIITIVQGGLIQILSAKGLNSNVFKFFDKKHLVFFVIEVSMFYMLAYISKQFLNKFDLNYLFMLFAIYCIFSIPLFLVNINYIKRNLLIINECKTNNID